MAEKSRVRRNEEADWLEAGDQFPIVVLAGDRSVLNRGVVVQQRPGERALEQREDVPPDHLPDRLGIASGRGGTVGLADPRRRTGMVPVTPGCRRIRYGRAGQPQGQSAQRGERQSHEEGAAHEQTIDLRRA
jgi:hypothetical protein